MLDAAQRLFERDGYVATTMEAIAGDAGVALKTVYTAFVTKAGVLRALWDLLLKGDADDAPVADRPWYRAILDEPDPAAQLRLVARNARLVRARIGPLLRVIRSAAVVDADSAALWRLIQSDFHENQRAVVETMHRAGRPAVGPRRRAGHRHPVDAEPPRRLAAAGRRAGVDAPRSSSRGSQPSPATSSTSRSTAGVRGDDDIVG
ncbi:MAG TPA: helix-turn-helix domain-containing protein [Acidimicrobiales bacterium]